MAAMLNGDNSEFESCLGKVVAIRKAGKFVPELEAGEKGALILDQTCFYAEQGGQIYDTGVLNKVGEEGTEFTVSNTQVRGGYIIFVGMAEGAFHVGDEVQQEFDEPRRWLIMKNHTGTHVLNHALQKVLQTVDQKGSLVAPDRMRFDFTAKQGLSVKQVKEVEQVGQRLIDTKRPVYARECGLKEAKEIKGLRAVFDETYPDPVRVVSIGVPIEKLVEDPKSDLGTSTSVEFCGGTHLKNVGHIGHLVITSEEAIAKGIRRIVAITGPEAEKALNRADRLESKLEEIHIRINGITGAGNTNISDAKKAGKEINEFSEELNQELLPYWRRDAMREVIKAIQKQLDAFEKQANAMIAEKVLQEAKELNEKLDECGSVVVHVFSDGANGKSLDAALRALNKAGAVVGFSTNEGSGKITVAVKVDKTLVERGLKASDWINSICAVLGGKGGGKDQQAQATCDNAEKLTEAVEIAKQFAEIRISST